MGQRHQIYVVSKTDNKYKALGAWHHQWCFGMNAVTNLTRLAEIIEVGKFNYDNKWCNYNLHDSRQIDSAVKSCFGISITGQISIVHNETNEDYLIDKDSGLLTPENGDNNDGCSLIIIDNDKKEVKGCLFTPGYLDGNNYKDKNGNNKAWSRQQYLDFYYTKDEQNEKEFKEQFNKHLIKLNNYDLKKITTQELKKCFKKKDKEIIDNILNTNGKIFSIEFTKRDGSIRKMSCRLGVKKGLNGIGKRYNDKDKGLVTVYDMHKKGYRSVKLNSIIKFNGQIIK